jgi:hypothetical protein
MTSNKATKGNSRHAMARRAARVVRNCNRWKVREGLMSQRDLARWAKRVRAEALMDPTPFVGWAGVVK